MSARKLLLEFNEIPNLFKDSSDEELMKELTAIKHPTDAPKKLKKTTPRDRASTDYDRLI